MTDQPRFRIAVGDLDERYRHYHGAAQVELFFVLVDTWRTGKWRRATSAAAILQPDAGAIDTTNHHSEIATRQGC